MLRIIKCMQFFPQFLLLLFSGLTVVYVLMASGQPPGDGPILTGILVGLFYIPAFLTASVVAIISLIMFSWRKPRDLLCVLSFALSVPMICYFSYETEHEFAKGDFARDRKQHPDYYAKRKLYREYADKLDRFTPAMHYLSLHLVEYYEKHPDRFHYIGSDDEVSIDGFADYVKSDALLSKFGLKVEKESIIDPWSEALRFFKPRREADQGSIEIANSSISGWRQIQPLPNNGDSPVYNPHYLGIVKNMTLVSSGERFCGRAYIFCEADKPISTTRSK